MMPLQFPFPSAACGTPSAVNVMQGMRRGIFPALGAGALSVFNRPVADLPSAVPAEGRRIASAVAHEAIAWGTDIGFTAALRQAAQCVPGAQLSLAAFQAFSALSDLSRGEMIQALLRIPPSVWLTPSCVEALHAVLLKCLPEVVVQLEGHPLLLLSLGVCGLLYARQSDCPDGSPRSVSGKAIITLLGCLRAGVRALAVLRPLRPVHASSRPALAGSAAPSFDGHPAPPQQAGSSTGHMIAFLEHSFPATRACLQQRLDAPGDLPALDAWPLPGGTALQHGAAAAGQQRSAATTGHRHRHTFSVRRIHNHARAPDERGTAMAPASARAPATSSTLATHSVAVLLSADATTDAAASDDDGADSPAQTAVIPAASCLAFHTTATALHQARMLRGGNAVIRFCLHPLTAPIFVHTFAQTGPHDLTGHSWMVSFAVRERVPAELRLLDVYRYGQIAQMGSRAETYRMPLNEHEVQSVLTVSVLSQAQPLHSDVASDRIMPPNSFKIVRFQELAGTPRTFIAYHLNLSSEHGKGVKAGFLEIQSDAEGGVFVVDEDSGLTVAARRLGRLADAIERISGCAFRPDADLPRSHYDERGALRLTHSAHLYVRQADLHALAPPYTRQHYNASLAFIDPVEIKQGKRPTGAILFRACFTIAGSWLAYVDEQGARGKLNLTPGNGHRGVIAKADNGHGLAFIQQHGLEGTEITMARLVERLESHGMTCVPWKSGGMLSLGRHTHGVTLHRAEHEGEIWEPYLRSWFSVTSDAVKYVDHDGNHGQLQLSRDGDDAPAHFLLTDPPSTAAGRFADANGLSPRLVYTLDDIAAVLNANGYVRIPA